MDIEKILSEYADKLVRSNALLGPAKWGLTTGLAGIRIGRDLSRRSLHIMGFVDQSDIESLHMKLDELERALEKSIEVENSLLARISELEQKAPRKSTRHRPSSTQKKNQGKA